MRFIRFPKLFFGWRGERKLHLAAALAQRQVIKFERAVPFRKGPGQLLSHVRKLGGMAAGFFEGLLGADVEPDGQHALRRIIQ